MSNVYALVERPFSDADGFHYAGSRISVPSERFAELKANGLVSGSAAAEAKMSVEPLNKMAQSVATKEEAAHGVVRTPTKAK